MGEKEKRPDKRKRSMPSRGEWKGQDFNQVSFGSSRPQSAAGGAKPAGAGGPSEPKRGGGGGNAQITATGIAAHKLDNETEELKHETVGKDLRLAISKGRTAKGLSQARSPYPASFFSLPSA